MLSDNKIPVSVVVMTRNEAVVIERCLAALADFSEVFVVDSNSDDSTKDLAEKSGAKVKDFKWNGHYPKKKQWCLDNLSFRHNWVLMVDADEVLTPALVDEIKGLSISYSTCAGYFIKGFNVLDGTALRHGLFNNKLMLIDRNKMEFPVVDDLDIKGGNEVEGHYQPVLRPGYEQARIVQLKSPLLHYIHEGGEGWEERHRRYVQWEAGMTYKNVWPEDPVKWRSIAKKMLRKIPARHLLFFIYAYILKMGILDGTAGYHAARDKLRYYETIHTELRSMK